MQLSDSVQEGFISRNPGPGYQEDSEMSESSVESNPTINFNADPETRGKINAFMKSQGIRGNRSNPEHVKRPVMTFQFPIPGGDFAMNSDRFSTTSTASLPFPTRRPMVTEKEMMISLPSPPVWFKALMMTAGVGLGMLVAYVLKIGVTGAWDNLFSAGESSKITGGVNENINNTTIPLEGPSVIEIE